MSGLGFRVWGLRFRVLGLGFRVWGSGSGFGVLGLGSGHVYPFHPLWALEPLQGLGCSCVATRSGSGGDMALFDGFTGASETQQLPETKTPEPETQAMEDWLCLP